MKLIRGLHNLDARQAERGCVLTIGNFDGVHRGHRAVIEQLAALADDYRAAPTLLTFEPHPREFFARQQGSDAAPARLTRLREKLVALRDAGLAQTLCVRFDRAFAAQSPRQFVETLLVERLGVRALCVGEDFRFGRGGAGDVATLRAAGREFGFDVLGCRTLQHDGRRVSSTWVRETLARGDLELAQTLLGRPYRVCGRVAHGDRIGRTIGFPTANVAHGRDALALSGVFAVRTRLDRTAAPLPGVANVGRRPTVRGDELRLEVHLFDFDGDIYGRSIDVEFVEQLRGEQKFASLDALKTQIARDEAAARARLGAN